MSMVTRGSVLIPAVTVVVGIGFAASACGSGSASPAAPPPYRPSPHVVLAEIKSNLASRQKLVGRVTIYYTTKQTVDIIRGESPARAPHDSSPAIAVYATYSHVPRRGQTGASSSTRPKPIEFFIEDNGLDTFAQTGGTYPPTSLPPGMGTPIVVNA